VRLVARPDATPLGLILLGVGVLMGAAIALLHLDHLPFALCWFKLTTGHPCMTCGTTRALGRMARADLAGALRVNPLATAGALGLLPWAAADLALSRSGRAVGLVVEGMGRRLLTILIVAALLVNWAYLIYEGV
jgi:hypothetical protein